MDSGAFPAQLLARDPARADAADETTRRGHDDVQPAQPLALALTIAYHPDLRRVGEQVHLRELDAGQACEVSRARPEFRTVEGRATGGLADPYISRAPLVLLPNGGGGVLLRGNGSPVRVNGRALEAPRALAAHELEEGVVIQLGARVLLLLHTAELGLAALPKYGLVGESAPLQRVRADILHVAGLPLPVLLRGESGTGKELVARALHAASARATRPCVCVNLAALNPQTAVAELFGHARGAFTGAIRARDGYFREADGGTLFLDEIGEAPLEVQVMLLRALETGEIQPIGGGAARQVDVRLIAATDANLEEAVLRGSFRLSLLHRLAGYEIWMPPLRRRRDDIARLLLHFLRGELLRCGAADLLQGDPLRRLPPAFVARLIRYDWPGNVRQLNNVARQCVALGLAGRDPGTSAMLSRMLAGVDERDGPAPEPLTREPASLTRGARGLAHISDAALVAALQHNRWRIDATARHLEISKTSLYALIERCPQIRKARDVSRDELVACEARHRGDLARMSEELRVSLRGLQLRLRELGLAR